MDNEVRQSVLERDNYQCRRCGNTKDLEVHHIIPIREGGPDTRTNLITLCKKCHLIAGKKKLTKNEIETYASFEERYIGYPEPLDHTVKRILNAIIKRAIAWDISVEDLAVDCRIDLEELDNIFKANLLPNTEIICKLCVAFDIYDSGDLSIQDRKVALYYQMSYHARRFSELAADMAEGIMTND